MTGPARPRQTGGMDLPALEPLPTAAERAAELIRNGIFEGKFHPGAALPETALAQALQVSRNTVREAFRTLMSEHLLVYQVHRGVSVRRLTAQDIQDIYRLRRMLELSALDALAAGTATLDLAAMAAVLETAGQAAADGDWVAVGTANLRFHQVLVTSHGSPRMNEVFQRLMTEMRLGFLAVPDAATFHGPYHQRNQLLHRRFVAGELDAAQAELTEYLDQAAEQVARAVAEP